jgi:hypothetical protein
MPVTVQVVPGWAGALHAKPAGHTVRNNFCDGVDFGLGRSCRCRGAGREPALEREESEMPEYMLSVYMVEGDELPSGEAMEQIYKDVDALNDRIRAEGAWVFGGGLHEATTATVVRERDGEVLTTDGPFVEAKEYLGGFWVIKAADLDEALAWAAKATAACKAPVEVRPFQDEPEA